MSTETLTKTPLAIAHEMTPEDRAWMIATAEGFGKMLVKLHEADNRARAARYPGVAKVTQGVVIDGKRTGRGSMVSVEATPFGLEVAKQIHRCGMKVTWPVDDDEDAS